MSANFGSLVSSSFGGGFEHQGFPMASETSFGNGGQDLTHVLRNSIPASNVLSGSNISAAGTEDPSK